MSRLAAISELMSEIRQCENTILFCEGQILRKRAAIHELFQGANFPGASASPAPPVPDAAATAVASAPMQVIPKSPSVLKMVEQEFDSLNGQVFHYAELRRVCIAKFPAAKRKIQVGVYPACDRLLRLGRIVRVPGGFQVKRTEQSPK